MAIFESFLKGFFFTLGVFALAVILAVGAAVAHGADGKSEVVLYVEAVGAIQPDDSIPAVPCGELQGSMVDCDAPMPEAEPIRHGEGPGLNSDPGEARNVFTDLKLASETLCVQIKYGVGATAMKGYGWLDRDDLDAFRRGDVTLNGYASKSLAANVKHPAVCKRRPSRDRHFRVAAN